MATDQFTTTLTFPRLFLAIKELLNSVLFDEIQILYHAHSVTRSVPAVNGSQPITWKATALKTESDLLIRQFGTMFFQKSTFLVSRSATFAIRQSDALVFQIILIWQVARADCTVHSTGWNQLRIIFCFHFNKPILNRSNQPLSSSSVFPHHKHSKDSLEFPQNLPILQKQNQLNIKGKMKIPLSLFCLQQELRWKTWDSLKSPFIQGKQQFFQP